MTTDTALVSPLSDTNSTRDRPFLIPGLAGLGFFAVVVTNNILRSTQPMPGASLEEVARWYVEQSTVAAISQGLFAAAIPCLLLFAVGTYRRFGSLPKAAPWSNVGAVGLCSMVPFFGAVMAVDITLSSTAATLLDTPALTRALFALKNSLFTLNALMLAVGIGGFGIAMLRVGLGPRWVGHVAAWGAAPGVAGAAFAELGVSGSPVGALGLVTFLAWLVFLVTLSILHLTAHGPGAPASPRVSSK